MIRVGKSLIVAATLASFAAITPTSDAQVLNWLFPLRPYRQAARRGTTAYYPTTANYPTTAACSTCAAGAPCSSCPTTTYYGGNNAGGTYYGSGGYYPTYGSWPGMGQTPVTAGYTPTTTYRTVLTPVPVTTYSPVAGGTCQQACTSYSWQARRVPYVAYQPTYASAPAAPACGCAGGCNACSSCATTACSAGAFQPVGSSVNYAGSAPACSSCQAATTAGYASTASGYDGTTVQASEWTPVSSSSDSCSSCSAAGSSLTNTYANYPSTSAATTSGDASEWRPVAASSSSTSGDRTLQPVPADNPPQLDDSRESLRPRLESQPDEDDDSTWRPVDARYGARRPTPSYRTDAEEDFARSEYYRYNTERAPDANHAAFADQARRPERTNRAGEYERFVGESRSAVDPAPNSSASRGWDNGINDKYRDRLNDGDWSYDRRETRRPSDRRYDWRASDDWDSGAQTNYRPIRSISDDEGSVANPVEPPRDMHPYASPVQLIPDPSREAARGPAGGNDALTARLASNDRWEATPRPSPATASLEGWQAAD